MTLLIVIDEGNGGLWKSYQSLDVSEVAYCAYSSQELGLLW